MSATEEEKASAEMSDAIGWYIKKAKEAGRDNKQIAKEIIYRVSSESDDTIELRHA